MTMHERIMSGKLFTDMCEGMPEERLEAKRRQKRLNDLDPGDVEGRVALLGEIFGKPCDAWIEPPSISAMAAIFPWARALTSMSTAISLTTASSPSATR